jgi:hypothetical protein
MTQRVAVLLFGLIVLPGYQSSALRAAVFQATAAASTPANLVTNGDFESGNTGFTTGYTYGNVSGPGAYWVGKNALQAPGAYPDWYKGGDHTTGTGNMLVVNGANSATTRVWEEIVPVTPNTAYTFSYWGAGVDHESQSLPHVQLQINGSAVGINDLPKNSPDNGGKWENFTLTWNSGSNSRADLALVDLNTETTWNDFALDDISFGPTAAASHTTAAGPFATKATVTVTAGTREIPLKLEEKVAFMFISAIGSLEDDCRRHVNRPCTMQELVDQPKAVDGWPMNKLKYDPTKTDPNYTYTITITGSAWDASAVPKKPGLGGFDNTGPFSKFYYNPQGAASSKDLQVGGTISGELFVLEVKEPEPS